MILLTRLQYCFGKATSRAVDRLLPTAEAHELIALTRDIADRVLDPPIVDAHEKAETYPEGVFAQLGAAGLLSLPQPEEWGAVAANRTRCICRCSRRSRRAGRRSGWR